MGNGWMGNGWMAPYQSLVLSSFTKEIGKWKFQSFCLWVGVYLPWIPQKQAIFFCHLWVPNTPSQNTKKWKPSTRFKCYVLKIEDDIYIDMRVERGNVASFINNSIGREEIDNVVWEYIMLPEPWNKIEWGFVMTIASRDIKKGEKLYAHYSVN